MFDPRLHNLVAAQPYPLLFATVSGAHLYGFPSPDSDYDLRGVHVLPPREVMGLDLRHETVERSTIDAGLELDLVTHDARKFFLLLLRKNGYVNVQHRVCVVPNFFNTNKNQAQSRWASAGFSTQVLFQAGSNNYKIKYQSINGSTVDPRPAGCASIITVGP